MADGVYATVNGFIQFPVEERELTTGQVVRDATIRSISTGDLIRITFWPDFEEAELEEGDFIAVDGVINTRTHEGKTYVNMNARALFRGVPEPIKEREVVKKSSKSEGSSGKKTF